MHQYIMIHDEDAIVEMPSARKRGGNCWRLCLCLSGFIGDQNMIISWTTTYHNTPCTISLRQSPKGLSMAQLMLQLKAW